MAYRSYWVELADGISVWIRLISYHIIVFCIVYSGSSALFIDLIPLNSIEDQNATYVFLSLGINVSWLKDLLVS